MSAFIADCRARGLSPRTLEQYEWSIRSFRAALPHPDRSQDVLAQLDPEAVRAWAAGLRATRRPTSVRSAVRALKVFGAWVAREGYATADPLAPVRLPRAGRPLIVPLSGDQVAALMKAGSPVLRAAVAILADTGLRSAELCGLAVDDLQDGLIRVRIGKGGRERLVPYGAAAAAEVRRYLSRGRAREVERGDDRLLVTASGVALTPHRLGELMRTAGRRLGIRGVRVSPHTLRHTFAIEFLRNGGGELALQKALGHRSLDMVRVYAELTDVDLARVHAGASPLDRWAARGTVRAAQNSARPSRCCSRSSGDRRA